MANPYPKLRSDLVIKRQVMGGEVTYLIKNRETSEYLRFRDVEWTIVELLNGQTSYEEMAGRFNQKYPNNPVDAGYVEDLIEAMKKKALIERSAAERSIVILEKLQAERKKRAESSQAKDVFYMTLATTNPERLYTAIYPWIRWIWTPPFVIATLAYFVAAATVIVFNWTVVRDGMLNFWRFQNKDTSDVVLVFCILAVIIAIHESAHALTCINFGGEVTELGFMLIYFMPAFYANVSDAYLFDKKWHKYWVTLAGGYSELILCSSSVFTWLLTSPDTFINHLAYNVMVFAGISTIIVNFNPLIKLDGYYLLSDILEVSNLRENSVAYVFYLIKSRIFRVAAEPPLHLTPRKKRIFLIYGILSTLYIITIVTAFVVFLFHFFTRTFPDFGIFLGMVAALLILKKRIRKLMNFSRFVFLDKRDLFRQRASVQRAAFAVGVLLLILLLYPFSHTLTAPVELEPEQKLALRAETAGYVAEVAAPAATPAPSDLRIPAGAVILRLRNEELVARRRAAEAEVERLSAESARALAAGEMVAYQMNLNRRRQAERDWSELLRQESRLEIHAPFAGEVLMARPQDLIGRHVVPGDVLCEFGAVERIRARIRVSEFDFRELAEGQPVRLKMNSFPGEVFSGTTAQRSQVSPETYDPAGRTSELVRTVHAAETNAEGTAFSHFELIVEVENSDGRLRPGMSGQAKITPDRHSFVARTWIAARDLFRSKVWW